MWPRWRSECGEPLGLDNWILCLGERGCSVPYVTMEYWGKRDRKHLGNLSLKSAPCPPSPSAGTARVRAVLQGLGLSPGAADTELVQRVVRSGVHSSSPPLRRCPGRRPHPPPAWPGAADTADRSGHRRPSV